MSAMHSSMHSSVDWCRRSVSIREKWTLHCGATFGTCFTWWSSTTWLAGPANGSCRRRTTILCLTHHLYVVSTRPLQVHGEVQASHRQPVPVPSLVGDGCGPPQPSSLVVHHDAAYNKQHPRKRKSDMSRSAFVQGRCTPSSTPSFVAFLRVSSPWPAPRTRKETRPRPS